MHSLKSYRNNCCAVALHELSGRSEHDVVSACIQHSVSFRRHRGMFRNEWLAAGSDLGLILDRRDCWNADCTLPTLKQWIDANPRGTFLIRVRRHVLVVRDGMIIDPNWNGRTGSRRRVHEAFRVDNAAASRNAANVHKTRAAAAAARNDAPAPTTKRAPGKRYDASPTFRFRKTPTTARALAVFTALAVDSRSADGWISLNDAERFGYTRKDFRNDARKERIEVRN